MEHITIGMLAHVDSGKTTLSESILYLSGAIRKAGRVDRGDSFLDVDEQERGRGITIFSKQAHFTAGDRDFYLLDTPGHIDFSAEMERTLRVLDYAVLIISGADGIRSHTKTLWELLEDYGIPVFLFVNKMDQPGTDRQLRLREIADTFGSECIDFGIEEADRDEQIAMTDEEALEYYMEHEGIPADMTADLIARRKVFPVFFLFVLKMDGVRELIAALAKYTRQPSYQKEFGARVYKIARDRQGNRLTFMKVTGGAIRSGDMVNGEKVRQVFIFNGEKSEIAKQAQAGMICGVTGLENTYAGSVLGRDTGEGFSYLEPVMTYAMTIAEGTDIQKAVKAMRQLQEEIPELHIRWDGLSREISIQLMGDIQEEVITQMIRSRWGIDVSVSAGRINYRETILQPTEGAGHFEPLRHYAEVHLRLEPGESGSGLVFETECSTDSLAVNYQKMVLSTLQNQELTGVLTGSPVTDLKITLTAGRASVKHSEGGDFREAALRAFHQGLMKAVNVLLEPYYRFVIEVPSDQSGRVMTDLDRFGGSFSIGDVNGDLMQIEGTAPVAKLRDYNRTLASFTGGRGSISCAFDGYRPCGNTDEVTQQIGYDAERDLANTPDSVFCMHGESMIVPWYLADDYMHISPEGQKNADEAQLEKKYEELCKAPRSKKKVQRFSMSLSDDDELKAIFEQTYGKIKPRLHQQPKEIRAPKEYVYKEAKKAEKPDQYLLVDGYNVIFAWHSLSQLAVHSMDAARDTLISRLSNYAGYTGVRVILVFDAYKVKGFKGEISRVQGIDVVFTREAETADTYIERTAHDMGRKYRVTVATSDGAEQVIIRSEGCLLLSSRDLEIEIERIEEEIRGQHIEKNPRTGNYIGNSLPADKKA